MSRRPFDAFEVSLCQDLPDGNGSMFTERVTSQAEWDYAADERIGGYYTVYGYRSWDPDGIGGSFMAPDGGAEALADFDSYDTALDLAYALADGKMITDTVPEALENVNGVPRRLEN